MPMYACHLDINARCHPNFFNIKNYPRLGYAGFVSSPIMCSGLCGTNNYKPSDVEVNCLMGGGGGGERFPCIHFHKKLITFPTQLYGRIIFYEFNILK